MQHHAFEKKNYETLINEHREQIHGLEQKILLIIKENEKLTAAANERINEGESIKLRLSMVEREKSEEIERLNRILHQKSEELDKLTRKYQNSENARLRELQELRDQFESYKKMNIVKVFQRSA